MRIRDLDEAIAAVSKIFVPHRIEVTGTSRDIDARLQVAQPTFQPLIDLSYGASLKIDAGDFAGLFLVKHCVQGSALATQGRRTGEWRQGQTMPLSAGLDTQLRFDHAFVQQSIRIDINKMELLCARWLGYPLERPLRFDLRPFSDNLEQVWRRTLPYLYSKRRSRLTADRCGKSLPG